MRLAIGRPELLLLSRALRAHRRRRPDLPFKLTWAVTWACQSGCQLCTIWKRDNGDQLSLGEIRRFLRSSPGFSWVDLTGGEPFLRDDLVDIGAAVVESNPQLALLHLPSNGLDPQRVERMVRELLALPVRRLVLTVSADGPPELNVALRGHPEAWTGAVDTLARLRALSSDRFAVYLGVTLSENNIGEAPDILPAVRRTIPGFGAHELHWNLAQESEHFYDNGHEVVDRPELDQVQTMRQLSGDARPPRFQSLRDPVAWLDRAWRDHAERYVQSGVSPVRCRSLWSSAFLDPEGTLYPCITWDKPLGNLRDVDLDFARLWAEAAPVADDVAAGRCPQCWTACEAVPSLLSSLPTLVRSLP